MHKCCASNCNYIVHGGQIIESNRIGMQVGVDAKCIVTSVFVYLCLCLPLSDVTCMQTNFGGCGLFAFGDITTFKNSQISLSDHGL